MNIQSSCKRTLGKQASCMRLTIIVLMACLSACSTLPTSGPSGARISGSAQKDAYNLINIDGSNVETLNASSHVHENDPLPTSYTRPSLNVIAAGDILQIAIHESGVSLFGKGGDSISNMGNYSATSERFPNVVVDQDGAISLPYIGRVTASGRTVLGLQKAIERAMIGLSQSPQVMIAVTDSPKNSAYLSGTVRKPGRVMLNPAGDRLLDMIAVAGGTIDQPYDTILRFTRGQQSSSVRLNAIDASPDTNIRLLPGDRIEVRHQPLTFMAMGAANKVTQQPFEAERISLAEALAKVSGLNDNTADPKSVFLFRNAPQTEAGSLPNVYRLDMMNPQSFYWAQNINVRDKDLIYIGAARANIPLKFLTIVNQLFSPLISYKALTN
jgi:polysaccharide biosynthesis/export protein